MISGNYLGIDFGTSGARAIVINDEAEIQAQTSLSCLEPSIDVWRTALFRLLQDIPSSIRQCIRAIVINGTSASVLICDAVGHPLDTPILYNDDRGKVVLEQLKAMAPEHHTVVSATSSLAKLLWWKQQRGQERDQTAPRAYFLHQADWLSFLLHGELGVSDYHNALKLGYDVEQLHYPDWLLNQSLPFQLPQVLAPGTPIAPVQPCIASQFSFPPDCVVCAGTTDSIAAFLASGAKTPGEAVTSLGSTLVLKLLSHTRIEDARYGVYSHRLGDLWLAGGASNTGGAILRQFFSDDDLQTLSAQIRPNQPSPFVYYPLLKPGERFPINDANLQPCLEPRPPADADFLQGLLESIARIEAQGYQQLQTLGAPPLKQVYTAGGGAKNQTWTAIRARLLQVPVDASTQTEAAYGSAILARSAMGNPIGTK
jgi:xylulokinase